MRKMLLFIFFSGVISFSSIGQDIQFFNDQNIQIPNNASIQIFGNPTDDQIKSVVWIKNSGHENLTLGLKKEVISAVDGSHNSFYWGSSIVQNEAPDVPMILAPDQLNKDFAALLIPNYTKGIHRIRYTFFDTNKPENAASIIIEFNTQMVFGSFNDNLTFSLSDAYPNPAESTVYFDFTLEQNVLEAKIIIRTLLGSVVAEHNLEGQHGKASINVDDFVEGIYFYSLMVDSELKLTKKLIVQH